MGFVLGVVEWRLERGIDKKMDVEFGYVRFRVY